MYGHNKLFHLTSYLPLLNLNHTYPMCITYAELQTEGPS